MQVQTLVGNAVAGKRRLAVALVRDGRELEEAQRLRYSVFAVEMGARINGERRIDTDRFDSFCEHLVVRNLDTGDIVGTYRILSPDAARAAGGCYSEQEFDLARLDHLRGSMAEIGRSCIHPDYRSGGVLMLLWAALIRYAVERGYTHLFGCASIGLGDGGHCAAATWRQVQAGHLGPLEHRVFPRCRLPLESLDAGNENNLSASMPPLVKGYLNFGAQVYGEPAWDPDFNTADLPVMLSLSNMSPKYKRHFEKNIIN